MKQNRDLAARTPLAVEVIGQHSGREPKPTLEFGLTGLAHGQPKKASTLRESGPEMSPVASSSHRPNLMASAIDVNRNPSNLAASPMSDESDGMSTLGERLREAREAAGMGQHSLARASGVSQSHISNVESGKRAELGPSVVSALAASLGVSLSWLMTGQGPKKPEPVPEAHAASPYEAAATMLLAQEAHEGRAAEAKAFLESIAARAYAGAEGKSPGWWLATLTEDYRAWRSPSKTVGVRVVQPEDDDAPQIPKLNARRAR